MKQWNQRWLAIVPGICALTLGACGDERGDAGFFATGVTIGQGDDEDDDHAGTDDEDSEDGEDESDDGDDPFDDDDGPPSDDGPGLPDPDDPDCAAVSESATTELAPVDVIFVVDNSGSMEDEAAAVQANLNGFSQQIIDSGIDVHVVLLSSYPGDGHGICIQPPLGAGGCPAVDSSPPTFTHVNQSIGSSDALLHIVGRHGAYADAIRPESVKHIVVVSDDNSAVPGLFFDQAFKDLDPSYDPYVMHGIVALHDCSDAASVGSVYIERAMATGGVLGDLCDQAFQPVFDELSTEVIQNTPIGCAWEIPPPPEGMELDPDAVNVELDEGAGAQTIGNVEGPWQCGDVVDGWFYDDPANPTKIHVCPQTCDRIQAATEGTIDILFGCATQSAPPAG